MSSALALDWIRHMLMTALLSGGPIVAAVATVGLTVAVVQAATQINDSAVAFVPKILVVMAAVAVGGPWITIQLVEFTKAALGAMASVSH